MPLFERAVAEAGKWKTYGIDRDTKKRVRFKLRPLPFSVQSDIRKRHGLTKVRRTGRKTVEVDLVAEARATAECATYAVLASENFEVRLDAEAAAEFAKATGQPAQAGDTCLDQILTDPVKGYIFGLAVPIASWCEDQASALAIQAAEDEAEDEEAASGN